MPDFDIDKFTERYGESPDMAMYRYGIDRAMARGVGAGPGAEPGVRLNRLRNGEPPVRGWRPSDDERHADAVTRAETHLSAPEPDVEDFQRTARELAAQTGLSYGECADACRELAFENDEATAGEYPALVLAGETLMAHMANAGHSSDDGTVRLAQEADVLRLAAKAVVDEDEDDEDDEDEPVARARKRGVSNKKEAAASEVDRLHEMSLKMFGARKTTDKPHGAVQTHGRP